MFCLDINGLFFLNSGSLCILCKYSLKTNGRHMTRREGCLPSYPTFRNDYSHLSNFSFYGLGFCSIYFCCPTQSKCQTTKSVYANFIFYVSNYICKHSKCYIFFQCLMKMTKPKMIDFIFDFIELNKRTKQRGMVPGDFITRQYLILDPNYWRNMLYKAIPLLV